MLNAEGEAVRRVGRAPPTKFDPKRAGTSRKVPSASDAMGILLILARKLELQGTSVRFWSPSRPPSHFQRARRGGGDDPPTHARCQRRARVPWRGHVRGGSAETRDPPFGLAQGFQPRQFSPSRHQPSPQIVCPLRRALPSRLPTRACCDAVGCEGQEGRIEESARTESRDRQGEGPESPVDAHPAGEWAPRTVVPRPRPRPPRSRKSRPRLLPAGLPPPRTRTCDAMSGSSSPPV